MAKNRTNKDGTPDKRCQKHDKPYCGTKAPSGTRTASFKMKARDGFANEKDYQAFKKFFIYKQKQFHKNYTSKKRLTKWAVEHCCDFERGNFYSELADKFNKPYLKDKTKCNNAWYYHNEGALLQRIAKGVRENRILASVCEKHDWDESHYKKINEEAHELLGRWFSRSRIKNICASRSYPEFPAEMAYELDYGTQSKYTIVSTDWETSGKPIHVEMTLLIGNYKKRLSIPFSYNIPERILLQPYTLISMRKPCFYMGDDGELWVTIPYWYRPADLGLGSGALGGDAGIVRIMKCGVVYKDNSFIENIALSPEVERKNAHIRILMKNKENLYQKMRKLERLIKHNPNPAAVIALEAKLERISREYSDTRSNIASEREVLCWLVARDISVLARQYDAGCVRIEDLSWVGGNGQSWNFSQLRNCIEIVLNRYGIKLEAVNACNSSKNDPSSKGRSLASGPTTDSRTCVWNDDSEHDRDDTSGLEIGCRKPGSVSHDRDAVISVDVIGDKREYAPEVVAVKPRGRKAKKGYKSRRAAGRSADIDYSYRPDLEEFYSSIRERRQELACARLEGGESFSWFDFVVGASRSVASLRRCRSVDLVPSGAMSGGVPTYPAGAAQSSTSKKANFIVKRR